MKTDFFTDLQAWKQSEIARWLDPAENFPPFEGAWAKALVNKLGTILEVTPKVGLNLLEQLIEMVQAVNPIQVKMMLSCLDVSNTSNGLQTEHDAVWLMELSCFFTLLSIDANEWKNFQLTDEHATVQAGNAPTHSLAIAARVYCRLVLGLRFEGLGGKDDVPNWLDIDIHNSTVDHEVAIAQAFLNEIRKQAGFVQTRRTNPDAQKLDELLGAIDAVLSIKQVRGVGAGLGIRKPDNISDTAWDQALIGLAQKLDVNVVGLLKTAHPDRAVTQYINPYTLVVFLERMEKAHLEKIKNKTGSVVSDVTRTLRSPSVYAWDFFVSHASEDKHSFVDELVAKLDKNGWRVGYDKNHMGVGTILSEAIEQGLKQARFAVLVVTPNSNQKEGWVKAEWQAVVDRDIAQNQKRVLPVLHGITHEELQYQHPLIARILAANSNRGLDHVVAELEKAVRLHTAAPQSRGESQ